MINGVYCHEIGCPNIKENTMSEIWDEPRDKDELDEEMEFPDEFEDDDDDEDVEESEESNDPA
jgi:hypothetical protein